MCRRRHRDLPTREQAAAYFDNSCTRCLFCGAMVFDVQEGDSSAFMSVYAIRCHGCGRTWFEHYQMTHISIPDHQYPRSDYEDETIFRRRG